MANEKTQHSIKKRGWIKWGAAVVVIILLLAAVRISLKSDRLFEMLRTKVVQQVEMQINGSLAIDSIRGDLFNGFTVYGIDLKDGQSRDVAWVDSVTVSYRLRDLIWSPHGIEQITVAGVQGYLSQDPDSVWNVMKLQGESRGENEQPLLWALESIEILALDLDLRSDILFPDGYLNVRNVNAGASGGRSESGYYGSLSSLEMSLEEARLPEPIEFFASAEGEDGRLTLESLVISSGRTILSSTADYRLPGNLSATMNLSPLAWHDIAAYADLPLEQNLDIEIGAEGRLSDLQITLAAAAPGLDEFFFQSSLSIDSTFTLNELNVRMSNVNTPLLTGMENTPSLSSLHLSGMGSVQFGEWDQSIWSGEIKFSGLVFEQYQIDEFESGFELNRDDVELAAMFTRRNEEVELQVSAQNIWHENPVWSGNIETQNLNLATWLTEPELESRLNIRAVFSGTGIDPDRFRAFTEVSIDESRFGDQPFAGLNFSGDLNQDSLNGHLAARLEESRLDVRFNADDWRNMPVYRFEATMQAFNLSELSGFEQFPTFLNGTLSGNGRGFDPEILQLQASAALDTSLVNREQVDTLRADFRIENQFLIVEQAELRSPIADGEFTLQQHLTEFTNTENRLNFRTDLKNIQPLAPLFELDRLGSSGHAEGELTRHENGHLRFNGEFDLQDTYVDTIFASASVHGNIQVDLFEQPEAGVLLEFKEPVVSGYTVQDLNFNTLITFSETSISGGFDLEILNEEICTLLHEGEFDTDSTRFHLRTTALDFTTRARTLSLDQPFDTEYNFESGIARSDTMTIRDSAENSFLSLWVPRFSGEFQEIGLIAQQLNLGALQSLMLDEPLVEGLMSGEVSVLNSKEELFVSVDGSLGDLEYASGRMESLNFYLNIEDEWLQGALEGNHTGKKLFEAVLQVPFLPGDPLTFDDRFFDREVEGSFELFESELAYWFSFLPEFDADETGGSIRMEMDLTGVAGNPELDGSLHVNNGLFSGISIDTAAVDLTYTHEEEYVDLQGIVTARENPVLEMDARLPFKVDLRQAEILLPDEDDNVALNFRTNNFNLALFNDFLDREKFRQLRGRLNGMVALSGRLAELETEGRMELTEGNLRVVPAGITLSEISSVINFKANQVELQQFSMKSGPGRIRATGSMEMEGLVPGDLRLNIRGNQFRAANTANYNALFDLNATLTGTAEEPKLTGTLTFLGGYVNLQNFGERSVEDVQLDDEAEPDPIRFYELLEMEMNVNFARQFFIRNRQYLDMEIELGGDVDLVKRRSEDLQMFGSLEGKRGYARPLGKNFELDEALVTFYGPVDDPELNIRTRFVPPQAQMDVSIFYIIEGTVQDPEFRFDSEPFLELQDIISYTLFGKPFYELESWEQVVAGSGGSPSAADLALDVLLDRVELLASQSLGIDVVQIDNTGTGSGSTTSIKTGWYLNRRTFFAVLNEISSSRPKTLFMLEYLLKENLELIITQGDDSREGIDLRWNYDY